MKQITFNLPDALADKFELAIQLSGDNRDAIGEEFVRGYLAHALQSAAAGSAACRTAAAQ